MRVELGTVLPLDELEQLGSLERERDRHILRVVELFPPARVAKAQHLAREPANRVRVGRFVDHRAIVYSYAGRASRRGGIAAPHRLHATASRSRDFGTSCRWPQLG